MTMPPGISVQSLSAPELLVLMDLGTPPREVLKAGLRELRARRVIGIERRKPQTRWAWVAQNYLSFSPDVSSQSGVLRHLVKQLRRASRHSENLLVVVQRLQEDLGVNFEHLKYKTVIPGLVKQGLLEPHSRKVLGLFTTNSHRHTSEGLRLKAQLEHDISQARQAARMLKDDPAQVLTLITSLGAAVILLPKLWHLFAEIDQLLQDRGDGYVFFTGGEGDPDHRSLSDLKHDLASLDSSVDGSDSDGDGGGGE
jgi:hypothetical protein